MVLLQDDDQSVCELNIRSLRAYHLQEQVTKALLLWRSTCIRLDTNQEAALEVAKRVEVQKQVMYLIWCDNVIRLNVPLVVLSRQ